MLVHAIAHCGCRDTVRESALEGSGRNIPCRTWDSNPRQYCAWLFSGTLYPLSYRRPLECRQERREDCCVQGQLSVLALIWGFRSTPVPFHCTRAQTIHMILPKVQVVGYSQPYYVASNKMVHGCVVYTKRARTRQQFHGTSHVTTKQLCNHFGGYSERNNK